MRGGTKTVVHSASLLVCIALWGSTGFMQAAEQAHIPGFSLMEETAFQKAARSARIAGYSLSKVQRWLHEKCLPAVDPETKLYLAQRDGWAKTHWNYQDTAADCYPFFAWAAFYLDGAIFEGPVREVLEAEQALCNHIDRLPVAYDPVKKRKVEMSHDRIVFCACEYVKDGLVAIVELTGKDRWFVRMKGIVEDMFKHAKVETPYGKIPSENIEVNGEILQILPRLYAMTGEEIYLDWADRLADHYLKPGMFVPHRLSDHGCEIIGGLGLLLAVEATARPVKFREYKPHVRWMLDEILRRGINADGIMLGFLEDEPGPHDKPLRDGWGYDYVAYLDYDMATGENLYWERVARTLRNLLKPRYVHFDWGHRSIDNIADSIEGGLYLLNRVPVEEGYRWADREMADMIVKPSQPLESAELWGIHKLESNGVRTVLIHAMYHTQNTILRPWQRDLQLGAAPVGKGIAIVMQADKEYGGKLEFDIPRHRIYMGFKRDWPRMNTVPEWFTVEPDGTPYRVRNLTEDSTETRSGRQLRQGLPVKLKPGKPLRLVVEPMQEK